MGMGVMGISFKKPVVLVIDDEQDLQEMLKKAFNKEGFAADISDRGREAIEKLKGGLLDFVMLEVMIPEIAGIEILQHVMVVHKNSIVQKKGYIIIEATN